MAKKQDREPLCLSCEWFRFDRTPAKGSDGSIIGTTNPMCGFYGYWFVTKSGTSVSDDVDEYELAIECGAHRDKNIDKGFTVAQENAIEARISTLIRLSTEESKKESEALKEELRFWTSEKEKAEEAKKSREPAAGVVYNIDNATITNNNG